MYGLIKYGNQLKYSIVIMFMSLLINFDKFFCLYKNVIQFCVMYLKFRYEYIEVEDVLELEEIGKWNVNQYFFF